MIEIPKDFFLVWFQWKRNSLKCTIFTQEENEIIHATVHHNFSVCRQSIFFLPFLTFATTKNIERWKIKPSLIKTVNKSNFRIYEPWKMFLLTVAQLVRSLLFVWLRSWFFGLWYQVRATLMPFDRPIGVGILWNPVDEKVTFR